MNPFRRIFGLGPSRMASRPDEVVYDNGQGSRMIMADDTTANGVAARHNFSAIYGAENMPTSFARRPVLQVQDQNGAWQNVTGANMFVPDMKTQVAAYQAFQKTGIIGPQPQQAGSMSTNSGPVGNGSQPGGSGGTGVDPLALPASSATLPPEAQGLLNAISVGESGGKYDLRYDGAAGSTFALDGNHPRVFVPGPKGPSSAAGRYMITAGTWDDYAKPGEKFDPGGQDTVAWRIAQDRYKTNTGRDLLGDLQSGGLTPQVMDALTPTWVALGKQSARGSYQQAYSAALTGNANKPAATPSMIGNQTQADAPPGLTFGTIQAQADPFRLSSDMLSAPRATRNDASIVQPQQTLADQLPALPGLVGRVVTPQAPQMITPSKSSNF